MVYGSGKPNWDKSDDGDQQRPPQGPNSGGSRLSNRYQGGTYQSNTGGGSYRPPKVSGTYADQQTQVMEDTMRTHYQAEETAGNVLSQMNMQRGQLQRADNNTWETRQAAALAKIELIDLANKQRMKKRKLQIIAAVMAAVDMFLFVRLVQCGGSFFCRRH